MAAVTTIAAGGWSTGSTVFSGGSGVGGVPTNADTVTITHAITLDTTAAVADSVVINASGSLIAQTAGDSKLIVDKTISTATNSTAVVTLDVSSVPQYKCEIYCNADTGSNANGITLSGDFDLKGAAKTAYTYTRSALTGGTTLTCDVDDASGWLAGDKLVFCTTQAYNSTPRTDKVTIATITAVGGGAYSGTGAATITWTDGAGAGGSVQYDHADNCIVGNFTRNLIIGPNSGSNADSCSLTVDTSSRATAAIIKDVEFRNCRHSSAGSGGVFRAQSSAAAQTLAEISNCAFYEWQGTAVLWTNAVMGTATGGVTRTNNIFYSATASTVAISTGALSGPSIGDEYGLMIFRAATGISTLPHGASFVDAKLSGCTTSAVSAAGTFPDYAFTTSGSYGGSGIWSCNAAIALAQTNSAPIRLDSVRLGLGPHATNANYSSANNANLIAPGSGLYDVEFYNCDENISGGALMNAAPSLQTQRFKFLNRDLSLDVQEFYQNTSSTVPSHNKSVVAAELTRSTSSLVMTWTGTANYVRDYVVSVPAKADTAIRILIYVAKSATNSPVSGDVAYGASTLPYATLSGLGITPVTVTLDTDSVAGYSSGVFELMAIDLPAASAPDADGELTLTLTGQSATSGAQCYWAGIPVAPFITRCRHYGYLFDETSLTRTRNFTVTVTASDTNLPTPTELVSSETTASGIGGITVSWAAGGSSITATAADKTFQEFYDYTQAQACLNVASALPITGAGVAGSPSLFAQGNVTISTTKKLSGSGSLSMGAYTLTSDSPWAFTYTGGTFSRASTTADVTFAGGTLDIGANGTYTFTQASSMTVSATPTSTANYNFGSGTFTGTLTFHNNSAFNVIVEVPAGTTTSSTGSPGPGTVTFSSPLEYQSVAVSGITTTSRLYIYDYSVAAPAGSRVLYNDVPGATSYTWTDSVAAVATRDIKIRIADVTGVTAKEFIEANIGTCAISGGGKDLTYLASQTSDTTYDSNGVDGQAIYATSGITFTDAATDLVNINIAADTVALKTIYACFVHWLHTALGIDDDVAYISAPDPANYILTSMKIRNTSTDPLKITGGYFYDSTGSVENCVDVTSPGNIYPMPEHVVPYQTTGTYAITGDIATVLAAIPSDTDNAAAVLSAAQTTPIHADIRKVLGGAIDGTGSDADPWGPV